LSGSTPRTWGLLKVNSYSEKHYCKTSVMSTRIYIGRLSYDVRKKDIEKFLKGYGRIGDILLKKGCCFVEFEDFRDADDAVFELNGKELLGERVLIEHARSRRGNHAPMQNRRRQGGGRDKSRSRSRSKSHSRSHSRSHSCSRSKSRSMSKSRSRSKSRSKSRSRSKSPSKARSNRSQSRKQSRSRSRSTSEDRRDRKSRSRSKSHKSRSRSRSKSSEKRMDSPIPKEEEVSNSADDKND
ncbi:hypothetical protein TNCT_319091, partial [Trichonephila clavata]